MPAAARQRIVAETATHGNVVRRAGARFRRAKTSSCKYRLPAMKRPARSSPANIGPARDAGQSYLRHPRRAPSHGHRPDPVPRTQRARKRIPPRFRAFDWTIDRGIGRPRHCAAGGRRLWTRAGRRRLPFCWGRRKRSKQVREMTARTTIRQGREGARTRPGNWWDSVLGALQVKTPVLSADLLSESMAAIPDR